VHVGRQARAQQAFERWRDCTGGEKLLVDGLGERQRVLDARVADFVVAGADYLQDYYTKLEHVAALLINEAAADMLGAAVGYTGNSAGCSTGNSEYGEKGKKRNKRAKEQFNSYL